MWKKLLLQTMALALMVVMASADLMAQTRIRFRRGSTSASVSGSIGGNGSRSFVLSARGGQYLSANLSSRSGCVVFDNGSTSLGYTTDSGNNYISIENNCRRSTSFTLTVSIR